MRIIIATLICLAVSIISTWIIILFFNLPPELISESFYTFIRAVPYIEVQFLFILGGDPIHSSNPLNNGLLLNFDTFPYYNMVIWFSAGIVTGVFSQNLIKGSLAGLNSGITIALIGWIVYWAILYGFDVNALMSSQMLYLLNIYIVNGLKIGFFSFLGGLIGAFISIRTGKVNITSAN